MSRRKCGCASARAFGLGAIAPSINSNSCPVAKSLLRAARAVRRSSGKKSHRRRKLRRSSSRRTRRPRSRAYRVPISHPSALRLRRPHRTRYKYVSKWTPYGPIHFEYLGQSLLDPKRDAGTMLQARPPLLHRSCASHGHRRYSYDKLPAVTCFYGSPLSCPVLIV